MSVPTPKNTDSEFLEQQPRHLYLKSHVNDPDVQLNLKATSLKFENHWIKVWSMKLNKRPKKKDKMQRIAHFKEKWLGEPTKINISKSERSKAIKCQRKIILRSWVNSVKWNNDANKDKKCKDKRHSTQFSSVKTHVTY